MEKKNKSRKYYLCATYATCSSCNLDGKYTSCYGDYEEKCVNEEVLNNIFIREDDSDWREPLVEE